MRIKITLKFEIVCDETKIRVRCTTRKKKDERKKIKKAFHFSFDDFPCLFPFVSKDQFSFQNATRKNKIKKFKNFMSVLLLQEIK